VISAYFTEAAAEGVRADLAPAQALHETGWFTNSDTTRNNLAGIGHPDGRPSGTPPSHPKQPDERPPGTTSPDCWTRISALHATMQTPGSTGSAHAETCEPAPESSRPYEGTPGNVPLATVEGITVHAQIASQVAGLVQAARADGFSLSGGGFRSPQRQIELRRQNCGSSNHELGLAVDFSCNGALIRSRSTSCFAWMAANAPAFRLQNLPSEPWQRSTDAT
jgi:hypothetical protein